MGSSTHVLAQTISHYRILEKLGGGGMGVVYKQRSLGVADAGLDFAFAIGTFDSARQRDGAVVRQYVAIEGFRAGS